jgi:hypothetical protein
VSCMWARSACTCVSNTHQAATSSTCYSQMALKSICCLQPDGEPFPSTSYAAHTHGLSVLPGVSTASVRSACGLPQVYVQDNAAALSQVCPYAGFIAVHSDCLPNQMPTSVQPMPSDMYMCTPACQLHPPSPPPNTQQPPSTHTCLTAASLLATTCLSSWWASSA